MRKHRAIYRLRFDSTRLLGMLALPLAFNLVLLLGLDPLIRFWDTLLQFWVTRLDFGASVVMYPLHLRGYELWLPTVVVDGALPSAAMWWACCLACVVAYACSYRIPPNRGLPLIYAIRALVLMQASSLVFFASIPASFPHVLQVYVGNSLFAGLCLLALIPWVLGGSYYLLDFTLLQKLGLTLLILGFFALALPLQYLLHVNLIAHASLLFMPVLNLVFGIFADVMAFVALYAFGMGWRPQDAVALSSR